ncbi:hydantoinase/oxoprolinase family protein [Parafrankia discariae]|uniref:hydantoinase/oxoprolinase family protein n=1 Tax=Parafrankia discariae TaxID=365528 RepID=UPI00035CAE5C|nr:hydantoinase/oxoprolinase family protein [Parafrankia discariae]
MAGGEYRIAVDVGGTFTDLVLRRPDGTEAVHKTSSVPRNPAQAVVAGLTALAAAEGLAPHELLGRTGTLVHGTTITTNALLTGTGARTGLVTTAGLRDVLPARQGSREDQFASKSAPPPPLVPRHLVLPVRERVDRTGRVVTPLDESDVRRAAGRLRAAEVEAVAVSFVFSYLFAGHERRAAAILARELPGVFVTTASRLVPQVRMFERTTTTALNAYVGPVLRDYLDGLARRLAELGYRGRVLIMQSNGGVVGLEQATGRAVETLLSGPAGAPAAVAETVRALGARGTIDTITIDMGGTSFEASLAHGGHTETTGGGSLAGHPVCLPALDISTVGAGGGSVAWVTAGGLPRVGPRSAGAEPGPASYGRGGTEPTVTDADLLLGYLDPDGFSDGIMLSRDAARRAVGGLVERLATGSRASRVPDGAVPDGAVPDGAVPDGAVIEAAAGVHRAVNAAMADSLRLLTGRRGLDPRRFALVAAGGAGPVHAVEIARELGIPLVVVPAGASVLCARGMLRTDLVRHYVRTVRPDPADPGAPPTPSALDTAFRGMTAEALDDLSPHLTGSSRPRFLRSADLRYAGQVHEIPVPFTDPGAPAGPAGAGDAGLADLLERFHDEHELRYGYRRPELLVEIVNLRLVARIPTLPPVAPTAPASAVPASVVPVVPALPTSRDPPRAVARRRAVWFDGGFREVDVHDPAALRPGTRQPGPALVAHPASTVVVPPGYVFELAEDGSVLVFAATDTASAVLHRLGLASTGAVGAPAAG